MEAKLTKLATVAAELGITVGADSAVDARIERYIDVGSDLLAQMCNRTFSHESGIVEQVEASRSIYLSVARMPILSVSKIEWVDGTGTSTEVDSSRYRLTDDNAESGLIERVYGHWDSTDVYRQAIERKPTTRRKPNYKVTYTAGWITPKQDDDGVGTRSLPHDIEDAIIQYAVMREREQGKDATVAAKSVGPVSVTYRSGDLSYAEGPNGHVVPSAFADVVKRYKRRAFA